MRGCEEGAQRYKVTDCRSKSSFFILDGWKGTTMMKIAFGEVRIFLVLRLFRRVKGRTFHDDTASGD